MTEYVLLMKNKLKLNMRMFSFWGSVLKIYFLKKQVWSYKFTSKSWFKQKKGWKLSKILKVFIKMNKRTINLLQKFDLNKKVENFKLKKNN